MMLIKAEEARAGDAIEWKGKGPVYEVLSRLLVLADPESGWDRWGWHLGYIVKILPDGEVVTSQAVAKGVEPVTYPSINDLGNCRFYRWLDNPDQNKIDQYMQDTEGAPYDGLDYLWVILGTLSGRFLHWPFRIVDKAKMCWENFGEFFRHMGKELQPEDEPRLISRMIKKLKGD